MIQTKNLFDLSHSAAGNYLSGFPYPWQALAGIKKMILTLGSSLGPDYNEVSPQVWVHKTAKVAPTAFLGSPCIIGAGTHDELIESCPLYREISDSQMGGAILE